MRRTSLTRLAMWGVGLVLIGASAATEAGQEDRDSEAARVRFALSLLGEGRRVTQHEITIRGADVEYDATLGGIELRNSASRPIAVVTYTSYTRRGVADPVHRPITFAWNGGPSAASTGLHFGALGPRRRTVDEAGHPVEPISFTDNGRSILDRTDLVMVDPVGTGFSVPLGHARYQDFYGIRKDAVSVAQFIRNYLEENGRLQSPVSILGESYGTIRSAVVAGLLQADGVMLNGVVFVASALDGNTIWEASGHLEPYFFYLPTYAAIAWYHDRLPTRPASFEALRTEVQHFALTEFVTTLLAWPHVAPAARASVLDKLHRYTGLSSAYWEEHNLRVGTADFARELLREEGLVLQFSDGRQTSPAQPTRGRERGETASPMMHYLRTELGITDSPEYRGSAPGADEWDWYDHGLRTRAPTVPVYQNFLDDLAAAMKDNPGLQVQQHSGIYDLQCSAFPADWAMAHMSIPDELRGNVQMFDYASGHAVFNNAPSEFLRFTENLAGLYDQVPSATAPGVTGPSS